MLKLSHCGKSCQHRGAGTPTPCRGEPSGIEPYIPEVRLWDFDIRFNNWYTIVMPSEAQKRATAKYQREKLRQYVIRFSRVDQDIIDKLEATENKTDYIRQLIKKDLKKC